MPKAPPRKKGRTRRDSEDPAIGRFPRTTVEAAYGCLGYSGPPATIEEMDEAVLREALKHK